MKINDKKTINAWCMYDWANSVYNLVITSTIFPIYYNSVTKGATGSDMLDFFGFKIINTVLYSYALSFSFLVIAFLSPFLSGMADYGGKKKLFMQIFTYIGAISCMGLFFFDGSNVEFGILCAVMASIGFSGGLVFYNAFLPEIATADRFDMVSARGYAMGYIGSVLLLLFSLLMMKNPMLFGFAVDSILPIKVTFLIVGVWWIGFAQYTFAHLPSNVYQRQVEGGLLRKGFQEISKVIRDLRNQKMLTRFLISFFLYSTGVQTIMLLAPNFGLKVLSLRSEQLIITILIIQLVAIGGSYLFALLSKYKGNIFSIIVMVFIWVGVCVFAYNVQGAEQFYLLAFIVGMLMGGIQSLSRSTYSKMIPETENHASYFSFFDFCRNIAIVVGTFSYGFIEQQTNDMRYSALALGAFFIAGLIFLLFVKMKPKAI